MLFLRSSATGVMDGAAALEEWNTVLAKAKKEGVVVVHGAPSSCAPLSSPWSCL